MTLHRHPVRGFWSGRHEFSRAKQNLLLVLLK